MGKTYAGTKVVTYKYDAWGNCSAHYLTSDHTVADTNIFRYRGYIYDVETGFYWLRTRYYDPVIGRFINADSLLNGGDELQGYNMYAYCGNNPVILLQCFTDTGNSDILNICGGTDFITSLKLGKVDIIEANDILKTVIGATPDFVLGTRYLFANGIHSSFAYATNSRYIYPIMGKTWRWFGKNSSSFINISQSSFRQILT